MKTYTVTIKATIIKDIEVDAENEEQACELAHEQFSVMNDGPEDYEQDTVKVEDNRQLKVTE